MVEHKTDSGHTIGKEFPSQEELTKNLTTLIQKINASNFTPEQKKEKIANLKGITRQEMKDLLNLKSC